MTTLVHLVRHGHHPLLGRVLCGRMSGVELDTIGREQMARCAELLAEDGIDAVQSSPQPRALQSANIIATRCGTAVELVPAIDEIDIGDWTGATFADLDADPAWHAWNVSRGTQTPPNGEAATCLQARMVQHIEEIRRERPGARFALVSHAEPIRVALMHYLKMPLDDFQSVEIEPAGISTLLLQGSRVVVARMNRRAIA